VISALIEVKLRWEAGPGVRVVDAEFCGWMMGHTGLYGIRRFAVFLRRDIGAVRDAISETWSDGQTEGPINQLKTLKRSISGRSLNESRPLAFFAGIWTRWTSVRKVKEGKTTNDIFAFLTTEPNKLVGTFHPKAMPIVLTTQEQIDVWMTAPPLEALRLQRPLPDDALMTVARGEKKDEGGITG
jgi:hypothetical protein